MSTSIGDITYIGGCEAVAQVRAAQFTAKDPFEPDHATVSYSGSVDNAKAFMDARTRGEEMTYINGNGATIGISTMWLQSVAKNEDAAMPEITCQYYGILDDLPPAKVQDSLVTSSVTTSATITDPNSESYESDADGNPTTKLSMTAEYRAARTNYSWYDTSEPSTSTPAYSSISDSTSPLTRITRISVTGSSRTDTNPTTVSMAEMTVLLNTLSAEVRVDDYQREEIIPGKLWRCSSSVQYVIVGQ